MLIIRYIEGVAKVWFSSFLFLFSELENLKIFSRKLLFGLEDNKIFIILEFGPVNSNANEIGFFPSLSFMVMSAPFFNNFLIKLGFSVKTATWRGVLPSLFLMFMSSISFNKKLIASSEEL